MTKKIITIAFLFFLSVITLSAQDKNVTQPKNENSQISVSYGIVVDNSGSYRMLLDKVVATVKDIVEENKADDETFLVRFVDSDKIYLSQDFTGDEFQIRDAADEMFIEGGKTAILDAVYFSAKHLAEKAISETNRRKILILITDGDDRQSDVKLEELIKFLKAEKIQIFAVGLSDEKVYTKLLDKLTKETNGRNFTPKTTAGIKPTVKELTAAIRAQ